MTARRPAAPVLEYVAEEIDQLLAVADAELASSYRGEDPGRQPVHTVYIPAHRFEPDAVPRWGADALAAMEELLPGPAEFADAMGLIPGMAAQVRPLVLAKLGSEPIEDLRIDFEDGYGIRSDATEDADARTAARSLAAAFPRGRGAFVHRAAVQEPRAHRPGAVRSAPSMPSWARSSRTAGRCRMVS